MEEANEFRARLFIYLERKRLKPSQFERMAGLANGWCGRATERMSRQTVERLGRAFPDLSIDWLVTGEGPEPEEGAALVAYTDNSSHNRYDNSSVGVGSRGADFSEALAPVTAEFGEWRKSILEIVSKHQESVREILDSQMKQNKDFLETIRALAQR